ncbi:protein phosphatase 2C domain-containing protein [Parafrankia sp. EUN1f]|uniref:protein phosphatase 2C domain-containing protein n=1 Tax=Parafrankia sp. EUN1f TaxID=102897 RepID=UPI0001C44AC6|nr:protein phosphatase 2C domain-containing protein [Parafrankia sp. EUN1f]EFC83776.1 hypothetical protein FrEUN1fDRAFT_3136 [Parafrankia sp. EUN1f]
MVGGTLRQNADIPAHPPGRSRDDRLEFVLLVLVLTFFFVVCLLVTAGITSLWYRHLRIGAIFFAGGGVVLILGIPLFHLWRRLRARSAGSPIVSQAGQSGGSSKSNGTAREKSIGKSIGKAGGKISGKSGREKPGDQASSSPPPSSLPHATDDGGSGGSGGPPRARPETGGQGPQAPPVTGPVEPSSWLPSDGQPDTGSYSTPRPDHGRQPAEVPLLGQPSDSTRSPWYLPVVSTQPAVAADQARLGTLEVRAASIIGPGHRSSDPATPRQDAYRLGRDTSGRHLIVAIADGMSDSARSDHGATVAVSTAVAVLRRDLDAGATPEDLSAVEVFKEASGTILGSLEGRAMTERDVRTGLIAAVISVHPTRDGHRNAWFGHLADLSAWLQTAPPGTGWAQVAGDRKDGGMDANTLSRFLPYSHGEAVDTYKLLPAGAVVALMSDGVSDALTGIPGAHHWFASRWATPPALPSFIQDISFEAKTFIDDRTAVVVWCDQPAQGADLAAAPRRVRR